MTHGWQLPLSTPPEAASLDALASGGGLADGALAWALGEIIARRLALMGCSAGELNAAYSASSAAPRTRGAWTFMSSVDDPEDPVAYPRIARHVSLPISQGGDLPIEGWDY